MKTNDSVKKRMLVAWLGLLLTCWLPATARADRPIAPKMLPENTLLYFRIANMPELREKFAQTATGRMAQDEKLKPLLGQLWQAAVDAFKQVEGNVGAPLNDLLAIPQGEICVAVVAPADGQPQLILWLDCGDRILTAQKLIERGQQAIVANGGTRTSEILGDVELVIHETPGRRRNRAITNFIKDNTVVIASDKELAKQMLAMWRGEQDKETLTLADNRKFTSIMSRCLGAKGDEPQVTWFADPFELARRAARGNSGAQVPLAIAQSLGVDGVKGVGGSLTFVTEEFDGIFHTHLLLESPRKGVIDALALQSGDVTPEPWVPTDVASYVTWNWDVPKTYTEAKRLFELFRGGEGTFKSQVLDPTMEQVGLDLESEVIQATAGRFTMLTYMEKPARLNSQSTLIAMKVKDAGATQKVLERIAGKFPERIKKTSYGGTTIFLGEPGPRQPPQGPPGDDNIRIEVGPGGVRGGTGIDEEVLRREEPCLAILDDYLVFANSRKLIDLVITTKSDASRTLANELDFKIIASKIQRQLGDVKAGMIAFNRPEEAFRQLYDMATSQTMLSRLKGQAANNPFFKTLDTALTDNPLPPFAVLAQYLAPGGALLTSDETGFHYMAFSLRREQ